MGGKQRYALVTGASSGIGLAISRELARRGWPLLMVSNEEKIAAAAQETAEQFSVAAIPLCMDLAQEDSARRLFEYCQNSGISVEVLVNNAGIFFFKDVCAVPPECIETVVRLHIATPALLCRLFAGQMLQEQRGGYIVNMASIAGWMMMPGIALYSSSKSFLRSFSRSMRHEVFDSGVSITAVCPGAVATGLYNLPPRYLQLGVRLGIIMPPERLARNVVKKMLAKKAEYIPGGLLNRLFVLLVAALPAPLVRKIKRKLDSLFAAKPRTAPAPPK